MFKKLTVAAMSIIFVLVLASCSINGNQNKNTNPPDNNYVVDHPDSQYISQNIDIVDDTDGKILINGLIIAPDVTKILGDDVHRNIISFYDNNLAKRMAIIEGELYEAAVDQKIQALQNDQEFIPYNTTQDYNITFSNDDVISITRVLQEYTGGANTSITLFSENFVLQNGSLLLLDDIFNVSDNRYIKVIVGNILEQIGQDKSRYFENVEQLLIDAFDKSNYYFEKSGVTFFYPMYAIAPRSEGIQKFTISYDKLKDIMKEEYVWS